MIALTAVQTSIPGGIATGYPFKTIVVGALLVLLRPWLPKGTLGTPWTPIGVGILVWVIWVLPEGLYPLLGSPELFDPFEQLTIPPRYIWIGFRLLGATVVVATAEEMFWRGFLIRWIVRSDFLVVPIGTFTWPSFIITSLLFASEHNRWLVGLIAGVVYNLLVYRTKSLWACVLAHAVTNLALGLYVLTTQQWTFW